jgi:type IV pilus assembly protein PilY1
MVHVFDGTDDAVTGGSETFAFIPSGVFTTAKDDGGKFPKGLQALTYQDGGAPIFKHHFYVNASPRTQDVDFNSCGINSGCTPEWHTIVVGGLGKGGNTIYAIDATEWSRHYVQSGG